MGGTNDCDQAPGFSFRKQIRRVPGDRKGNLGDTPMGKRMNLEAAIEQGRKAMASDEAGDARDEYSSHYHAVTGSDFHDFTAVRRPASKGAAARWSSLIRGSPASARCRKA